MDDQRIGRTRAPELRPLYCYKTVAHHPTQTARDDHQSIMNAVIAHTEKMDGRLNPPSSKNYTTRHLLVAALAEGESTIHYPATSEDSTAIVECLRKFGARIDETLDDCGGRHLTIVGFGRKPQNPGIVDAGNAGAVLRFLMGLGALVGGEVRFSTEFETFSRAKTTRRSALCPRAARSADGVAGWQTADCHSRGRPGS